MSTLTITKRQFMFAAQRIKPVASSFGFKINLTLDQRMHFLSMVLCAKPYDKIKHTLFSPDKDKNQSPKKTVYILHLSNSEAIVVYNECFVTMRNVGLINEVNFKHIHVVATSLAKEENADIKNVFLPALIDDDEHLVDSAIQLAKSMGYFNSHPSIFEVIESAKLITVDNRQTDIRLSNHDWESNITVLSTEEEDGVFLSRFEGNAWMPETDEDDDIYISFTSLCNAKYVGNLTWEVDGYEVSAYL